MINIKDLSIGTKLMGSYGIIILFLLILLFTGFLGINTINNIYDNNNRNIVPSLIAAKNIEISVWTLKESVFSYAAGEKSARDEFQNALLELDRNIEESRKISNSEERSKIINSVSDARNDIVLSSSRIIEIKDRVESGEQEQSVLLEQLEDFDEEGRKASAAVQDLVEYDQNELLKGNEMADGIYNRTIILSLIIGSLSIIISMFLAIYSARSITRPMDAMLKASNRIANGDLTLHLKSNTRDEIGKLFDAIDSMTQSLRNVIGKVNKSTAELASTAQELSASSEQMKASSEQISSATHNIAEGATSQATKISEVNRAMKEMSESIQQVAVNSQKATEGANIANTAAQKAGKLSEDVASRMSQIKSSVNNSTAAIRQLDNKSEQIGEITVVITNIADQTNLLALNAAIEAARAGDHGKGFAVVADEVRKLAEESRNAASRITGLIKEIQNGTKNAVMSMEEDTKIVVEGEKTIEEAVSAVNNIVKSVSNVTEMIEEMAAATQEQSAAVEEVTASIEDVDEISLQSVAGTQESSAAAQEQSAAMEQLVKAAQSLAQLSEELQNEVTKFKLVN